MLRVDLTELLRTPGMRQVYTLHEPPFTDEDVEYLAPITGNLVVTNTGTMVLVRGPVDTVIGLECSRCLEPVRAPIHADLEEEFELKVVDDAAHHAREIHVAEEEIGRVFDGKVMQLDVLIRQAALLQAPLQPLCRENCPGIAIKETQDPEEEARERSPFRALGQLLKESSN